MEVQHVLISVAQAMGNTKAGRTHTISKTKINPRFPKLPKRLTEHHDTNFYDVATEGRV